ncbi:MAG TPA: glycosyltransferase family 39 protein, partial [Candidatus Saccharimonadales bacterium]
GIPVLLMPYIGALKAYIFYPIFKVFGVSAVSMRLPDILLAAGGLYALYRLASAEVGKRLSLAIVLLTGLDASFIMFTRLDNGPVVLDFLLKMLGMFALLRFVRARKLLWLAGFWLVMLLGTFNKLNFIWDVNALAGAFVVAYGLFMWRKTNRAQRLRALLISIAGYGLNVGYYLYINKTYHLGSKLGFVGWRTIYNNLADLVQGGWFYHYAFAQTSIGSVHVFWIMLIAMAAGVLCLARVVRMRNEFDPRFVRFFVFAAAAGVLLLGQIAITPQATAGWHYFSVYPLFGVTFTLALYLICRVAVPQWRRFAYMATAAAVGLLCVYQLGVYRQYVAAYNRPPGKLIWSTAIYQLTDYAKVHRGPFVSMDWGTQTQLLGFDPVPGKYVEMFGPLLVNDPAQSEFDFQKYIVSEPGALYVTHAAGERIIPDVTTQFFDLAAAHGYRLTLVKTIYDGNRPVFEIYSLQQK